MIGIIAGFVFKENHLQKCNYLQPPDAAHFFHGGCNY